MASQLANGGCLYYAYISIVKKNVHEEDYTAERLIIDSNGISIYFITLK